MRPPRVEPWDTPSFIGGILIPPSRVKKIRLDNGVTLLQQSNPFSKSFCIGVWFNTGSRDERDGDEGICHFLEHMLFKGTSCRSAFELSQSIEKIGGSIDAFTTREHFCVYAAVLENHWRLAVDLLGDIFMNSVYPLDQVRLEKQVVLEEIRDTLDSPDDLIHDHFNSLIFKRHPLGRPILGYKSSVAGFSRKKIVEYSQRVMKGGSCVISVYGNANGRELRKLCERLFQFEQGKSPERIQKMPPPSGTRKHIHKKLHQQHICLGSRGVSTKDDRKYAMTVLSTLLGGSMSSRLFQRVREEQGLAYNIYSFAEHGRDAGVAGTYLSVKPEHAPLALESAFSEFEKVRSGQVSAKELRDTKEYLRGRILLGLEASASKMMRLARNEMYFNRQVSEIEFIRKIKKVTLDEIAACACATLNPDRMALVTLGPKKILKLLGTHGK